MARKRLKRKGFCTPTGLTPREDVTYSRGMSRSRDPVSGRAPKGRLASFALVPLAVGSLIGAAAHAAPLGEPAPGGDPMARLLMERGLWPADPAVPRAAPTRPEDRAADPAPAATAEPTLARQVRDRASELVVSAMNFLGVPYKLGGNDAATGFDCSGFTRHLFEMSFGLVLPRRVDDQASAAGLVKVPRQELQPGDLVFFNTLRRTFSHVGIYVGDGRFIHAPRTGAQVRVEDMHGAYWSKRFTGARRVADAAASPPAPRPTPAATVAAAAPRASAGASRVVDPAGSGAPAIGPQSVWLP
jgi:cell wall-associated NlpC family hydrolase